MLAVVLFYNMSTTNPLNLNTREASALQTAALVVACLLTIGSNSSVYVKRAPYVGRVVMMVTDEFRHGFFSKQVGRWMTPMVQNG
jgi:hypothetical protein